MSIIIGIDHGYYAIKTAHCSFPAGLTSYGEHEPYTRQGLLEFGGCFFVCGSGRQPIQRDKTVNDNYYLLTLAAIAKEILQRGLPPECSVRIAAGLPLTSFGRDKPKFRDYLLRSKQPVNFRFEDVEYSITIEEVAIFPQGYAALMTETGLLQDEPSMLLMDLGGWTVDLMRIDNAIPVADTAHSLELGMIRCVDDIREQVRRETGLSLTDAQIENMLAGQPCTVSQTTKNRSTSEKYSSMSKEKALPDFDSDQMDQLSWMFWTAAWLQDARRIAKPGAPVCLFIDWRQLPAMTLALQWAGWTWRGVAVWDKVASRPQKGRFRQQSEYIVWGSNGKMPLERNVGCLPGVFRYPNPQNRIHVTEKPLQLMRDVVQICEPSGRILDPFAGAGTTVLAAVQEGYEAVGIEMSDAYFQRSAERLKTALESEVNQN